MASREGVRVIGLDRLRRKLGELEEAEIKAIQFTVKASALNIEGGAKRRVLVDRGRTRNAISHLIGEDGMSATIGMVGADGGTMSIVGKVIEYGRRPGSYPPPDAIKSWMKRKGIPLKAYWPIMRKLFLKGTAAHPFLFPAFEEEVPKFKQRLQRALERAAREVAR